MNTMATDEKLAEALRGLLALTDSVERDPHSGAAVGVNEELAAAQRIAAEALTEHDAQPRTLACTCDHCSREVWRERGA